MTEPKYPTGTKFKTRGKHPKVCEVVDIWKTYNSKNALVRLRYVATHVFNGQLVFDYDVPETTIAMGLIEDRK